MKNRYVQKLKKEDVLNIHRKVVCSDTQDVEIEEWYAGIRVTAYENWPEEDGTPAYVPTEYFYFDTRYKDWDTSRGGLEVNGKYRQELANIFGKEYLLQLLSTLSGIEVKKLEEMLYVQNQ